jgi:hypothetical protein
LLCWILRQLQCPQCHCPSLLLITQLSAHHEYWKDVNLKIAERLYVEQDQRQSELLLDDAATRYAKFLATYPGLVTRVKQHHIAS